MKKTRNRSVSTVIGTGMLAGLLALSVIGLQSQPVPSDRSQGSADAVSSNFQMQVAYERPGDPKVATEASASFDPVNNNGLLTNADFIAARAAFDEVEVIADGLGPTYNAQACRECHQNVVSGGDSQINEVRTGSRTSGVFFESMGGSLIQARATFPDIVEHIGATDNVRTERKSIQVLGDGFVECIANNTLLALSKAQPSSMRGIPVAVPVLEAATPLMKMTTFRETALRYGRFGWKNEHASLVSFSGDAYLNEMGITNPLFPDENLSDGRYVGFGTIYDPVPELEDNGDDVLLFADFMPVDRRTQPRMYHIQRDPRGTAVHSDRVCHLSHRHHRHSASRDCDQRRGIHRA